MTVVSPAELAKCMKKIRALLERTCVRHQPPPPTPENFPLGEMSFYASRGELTLNGENIRLYRECEEALASLHGSDPTARILSVAATSNMLQQALIESIPPANRTELHSTRKRRVARALRRLKARIAAPPQLWNVCIQVRGIDTGGGRTEFGGIRFAIGSEQTGAAVASWLPAPSTGARSSRDRQRREREFRTRTKKGIARTFSAHANAEVEVEAVDSRAAKTIATERVRRCLDILNFFAPYCWNDGRPRRAYLLTEGERGPTPTISATPAGDWNFSPNLSQEYPLPLHTIDGEEPVCQALVRSGQLLTERHRSELGQRILNALSWAGQAVTETRPERAYLLNAIALESLLMKQSSQGGVTDRLKLRIAHLIGRTFEARREAFALASRMYRVRSSIVHAGDFSDLKLSDSETMRFLVQRALTTALQEQPFAAMTSGREFEDWLDHRVLAGGD